MTIGVGMGPTKTLAKSAQLSSKEWPQFNGVVALTTDNPRRTEKLLALQPAEEIWGVGRRISKKLGMMGITTALLLARANPTFIRKNFNVVLERTERRALYFTGRSAFAETADSLQPQLWTTYHRL
ncbi:SOS mutagenesis and repair protein UmuC [Enterobacter kobei]|nr:SOS mutagenesis and repair protein UmuC [Enterobacter kobei]